MIKVVCLVLLILIISTCGVNSSQCPCEIGETEPGHNLRPINTLCALLEPSVENPTPIKQSLDDACTNSRLGIKYVDNVEQATKEHCSVLFVFVRAQDRSPTTPYHRSLCPGKCEGGVPHLVLPADWFRTSTVTVKGSDDLSLTCSLSLVQFMRRHVSPYARSFSLATLIKELYWRRIQECNEEKVWMGMYKEYRRLDPENPARSSGHARDSKRNGQESRHKYITRRKVSSVVIWVGSTDQMSKRIVHAQSQTLLGQINEGTEAVVGWSADDYVYPCRKDSYKCPGGRLGNRKFKYLPASDVDAMGPGWACAQRRPMRSLAHVLLLYDPSFIVLVDDDTYVNYPLLLHRFGPVLRGNAARERPVVLGELRGRQGDAGHVSKDGFVIGGSGYILGRNAINRLQAREVAWLGGLGLPGVVSADGGGGGTDGPLFDEQRSTDQMKHLSVLAEAVSILDDSSNNCTTRVQRAGGSYESEGDERSLCVGPLQPRRRRIAGSHAPYLRPGGVVAPSKVGASHDPSKQGNNSPLHQVVPAQERLVDFCAKLMSGEHTCQHSDHVMGRCLLYGADAVYANVACESLVPLETVPPHIPLGMCFMAKECDVTRHVTCHRYLPSGAPLLALRGPDGRSTDFEKDEEAVRRAMQLAARVNFRHAYKRSSKRSAGGGNAIEIDYSKEVNNEPLRELMQYLASGGTGEGYPVRKPDKASNFRVFSSTWDGNVTDTH